MANEPLYLDNLDLDEQRKLAATGAWADPAQQPDAAAASGESGSSAPATTAADDATANVKTVVFVDASLAGAYALADNTGAVTVVIDGNSDGIQQIADYLAGHHYIDLTTIGIVGPSDGGTIEVGGTALSSGNIDQFSKSLAEIGAAVQPGGQLIVDNTAIGGNPDGRELLTKLAGATNLTVGAPVTSAAVTQTDDGADPASASGADPQLWFGVFPDHLVHAINPGNNTATSITSLTNAGFNRLSEVQIDPVHGFYFVLDEVDGASRIVKGTLSQAVSGTLSNTAIYTDNAVGHLISNIAIDEANQLIYFTENNEDAGAGWLFERMDYNGNNRVTLATFTSLLPSNGGLVLDLVNNRAYVDVAGGASSNTSGFHPGTSAIYVGTGLTPTASSVAFAPLPLTNLPTNSVLEGLTIDLANQDLYFVTDGFNGTPGGVFKYVLNAVNPTLSSGTITTVWSQPTTLAHTTANAWEALQYITFDPGSGNYYLSTIEQSAITANEAGLFVGSTAGGAPTLFIDFSTPTTDNSAPFGIYIDDFPTLTASHPSVSFTEGGSSVLVDSALTVTKPDTTLLASASVVVSGFAAGDTLTATTTGTSITTSFSSGTLTLTGVDTVAHYQSVLESVRYAAADTNATSRTLTFTVSDGLLSASGTDTVTIVPVAEAPSVSTTDTTMTVGVTSAPLTISVAAFDSDDTLGLVTITGLPSGFSLNEGTDLGGGTWTEPTSNLPTLAIIAPSTDTATLITLGVTATSSEGSQTSGSATTVHVNIVPCYCRGTRILTEHGEAPVEELAIGGRVMTVSGALRAIRWIGRRAYDGRFIGKNRAVLPICVTAGALADGVPARDLWLSPEHSLYLDGVLVRAEHLVNGATIVQAESVSQVEYFHLELDSHDVLFAEGAPAETYVDCDNRLMFANAAEFASLYPEDERPAWQFCAPRLEWGSEGLSTIRTALFERAEALGHRLELDPDPDLHLIVGDETLWPQIDGRGTHRFTLPAGAAAVWLASRSIVPAEIIAASRDVRRLGVPVERIVLADADFSLEAGHGHAELSDGFNDDEPTHRWTDGAARIPDSLLRHFAGPLTLEVHLAPSSLGYRLPASAPRRRRGAKTRAAAVTR